MPSTAGILLQMEIPLTEGSSWKLTKKQKFKRLVFKQKAKLEFAGLKIMEKAILMFTGLKRNIIVSNN